MRKVELSAVTQCIISLIYRAGSLASAIEHQNYNFNSYSYPLFKQPT